MDVAHATWWHNSSLGFWRHELGSWIYNSETLHWGFSFEAIKGSWPEVTSCLSWDLFLMGSSHVSSLVRCLVPRGWIGGQNTGKGTSEQSSVRRKELEVSSNEKEEHSWEGMQLPFWDHRLLFFFFSFLEANKTQISDYWPSIKTAGFGLQHSRE